MFIEGIEGPLCYGIGEITDEYPTSINVSQLLKNYQMFDYINGVPFIIDSIYTALEINDMTGRMYDRGLIALAVIIRDMHLWSNREEHHLPMNTDTILSSYGIQPTDIERILSAKLKHRLSVHIPPSTIFEHIIRDSSKVSVSMFPFYRSIVNELEYGTADNAKDFLKAAVTQVTNRMCLIERHGLGTLHAITLFYKFLDNLKNAMSNDPNIFFRSMFRHDKNMMKLSDRYKDKINHIGGQNNG